MKDSQKHTLTPVRLVGIRLAAERVNFYEFGSLDESPLEWFERGAHIDLHLSDKLVRQYSLLPGERGLLRIAVQTEGDGRGGSRFLAQEARVGQIFQVSESRNHFPLIRAAPHYVLIAGGIGITPLYEMIGELARAGASWELHYAVRSEARMVYRDELRQFGGKVRVFLSDRPEDGRLDIGGIVSSAPPGSEFYCCGPQQMVDAFVEATTRLAPENVHVERFAATPEAAINGEFDVKLARSGKLYTVAAGSTILQTLRDSGIDLQSSCEQGVCGVCETRVLPGEPEHRDHVLSAAERASGDTMMICCSGSRGPLLVLDL